MSRWLAEADDLLRARGDHRVGAHPVPWARLGAMIGGASAGYGVAMGLYEPRIEQVLYSAIKVPLLLGVSSALCFANFLVVNTVLGLRDDLPAAIRGILSSQGTVALCLLSLAPVTLLAYVGDVGYAGAKLLNGSLFAGASLAGQLTLFRHYRVLIAKAPAHRWVLAGWFVLYVFVAVQFAWVLRPFIGSPELETRFLRTDAWGNAYVEVLRAAQEALQGL